MVEIAIHYTGDLHCTATHGPSQASLQTDAPRDNQGRGECFSPTDLVAAGLGTCMATVMGIAARKHQWSLPEMRLHVTKKMTSTPPRRIQILEVEVTIAAAVPTLDRLAREALEHAAHTCPVRLSLLDAIEVPVRFTWQEA